MSSEATTTSIDPERFDDAWDFDDPAATEVVFRGLVEQVTDPGRSLELQTQIARTLSLQRRVDEAHATLDAIEAKLDDAAPVVRVRYLLERGRTFNSAGDRDSARLRFLDAWGLARSIGTDAYAIDAAHMVAITETGDDVIAWNERGLELARTSDDPRALHWRGSLTNNMGWTEFGRGNHDAALAYFDEALASRIEEGDAKLIGIARWCVARVYRALGRVDEALAIQRELLAAKPPGAKDDGFVQEELGECLKMQGRDEEARLHFMSAYVVLVQDEWLVANEPERLERLRQLGAGKDID